LLIPQTLLAQSLTGYLPEHADFGMLHVQTIPLLIPLTSLVQSLLGYNDNGRTLLTTRYDQLCPSLINIAASDGIDKLTSHVTPIYPQSLSGYYLHATATRDASTTLIVCATIQDLLTVRSPAIGNALLWCPRHDVYSRERLINTCRLIDDYDEQMRAITSHDGLPLSTLDSKLTETMQDMTTPV
jgi:hypothetical protein